MAALPAPPETIRLAGGRRVEDVLSEGVLSEGVLSEGVLSEDCVVAASEAYYFSFSLSALPARKVTPTDAGMWIRSLVCGLVPMRALRSERRNVPKPRIATSPSFTRPSLTELVKALSARSASALLDPRLRAMASMTSALFMRLLPVRITCAPRRNASQRKSSIKLEFFVP